MHTNKSKLKIEEILVKKKIKNYYHFKFYDKIFILCVLVNYNFFMFFCKVLNPS